MLMDFVVRALLAGTGVALVAGPLGCLMVWRRMANFGDALAHSTLLGVSLAMLLHINVYVGLIALCMAVATTLVLLSRQRRLAHDTVIGLLSQVALAIGLVVATCVTGVRMDLLGYLYGDILSVTAEDVIWIYGAGTLVLGVLFGLWRALLSITVHEDLARVEGVPVDAVKWIFVVALAMLFAIAMKIVGVLLITALLIIPSAAARYLTKTPEHMVAMASAVGVGAVFLGVLLSQRWDWPAGPAIVMAAGGLFVGSLAITAFKSKV